MVCDMCFQIELLAKELKEDHVIQHDETVSKVCPHVLNIHVYHYKYACTLLFDFVQSTNDVRQCSDAECVDTHDTVRFVYSIPVLLVSKHNMYILDYQH